MKGMITGLTLDDSVNDLARKFNIALEVCLFSPLPHFFPSHYFISPASRPMSEKFGQVADDRQSHFKLDISLMR